MRRTQVEESIVNGRPSVCGMLRFHFLNTDATSLSIDGVVSIEML